MIVWSTFSMAFELSCRSRRVILQNLVFFLGVVVVLVCEIPLSVGVLGQEDSPVLVVLNSLRLRFQKKTSIRNSLIRIQG